MNTPQRGDGLAQQRDTGHRRKVGRQRRLCSKAKRIYRAGNRKEGEQNEAEIEDNPQLKAMEEQYNEKRKLKEKEEREDFLKEKLRLQLTDLEEKGKKKNQK